MNMPALDMTTELPATPVDTSIYGIASVPDANYAAEPGQFSVVVDLGSTFTQQPIVTLTRKLYQDDSGGVIDSGDHRYAYYWLDPVNFSKFELRIDSSRLNYPPSFAYQVVGQNRPDAPALS